MIYKNVIRIMLLAIAISTPSAFADWGEWCAHGGHGGHEPVIIIVDNHEECEEFCGEPPDCSDDIVNKQWIPA